MTPGPGSYVLPSDFGYVVNPEKENARQARRYSKGEARPNRRLLYMTQRTAIETAGNNSPKSPKSPKWIAQRSTDRSKQIATTQASSYYTEFARMNERESPDISPKTVKELNRKPLNLKAL